MLILNHCGKEMINSLTQTVQFGLRDKQATGKAPAMRSKGIYATAAKRNWSWKTKARRPLASPSAWRLAPSQTAQTCYVQTLFYANTAETAGTFNPEGVIEALGGFEFDGLGNGPTLYRAEDHQCFTLVLVVQDKENPKDEYDLLQVIEEVPTEKGHVGSRHIRRGTRLRLHQMLTL
jgi:branched-chain amino acid transport system substrate-binding protein